MNSTSKVFSIEIEGTVDSIWNEITKTDSTQAVMFNMKLDTSFDVGTGIWLRSPDGKYTGIIGKVTRFDPKSAYGHSFKFTQYDEAACDVLHELTPTDDGKVRYTMTCTNMAVGAKTTKQMTQGGDMIVKNLKHLIEQGKLPLGTRALYFLFSLMAPFSPKSMLSENFTKEN